MKNLRRIDLAQEKMLAICEENHITLAEIVHDAITRDAIEIVARQPGKWSYTMAPNQAFRENQTSQS